MLLLFKQLDKLPLGELKPKCQARIARLSQKGKPQQSKGEAAIRLSRCLLKVCEEIDEGTLIPAGFVLLEYLKGLTMEVHETNRVEVYLVKIRTYLLTIRWSRLQQLPLAKLLSRATLFLEQMKATPLYEAIASDFYSHVERLYLEVIQEKIRRNLLGEATRVAGVCFEAFKAQLAGLCALFDPDQKKLQVVLERKLELLEVLFRYEHGVKVAGGLLEPEQVTAQILPKYERITLKVPTAHFPPDTLVSECETAWTSVAKSIKHNSLSKRGHSISLEERNSSCPFEQRTQEKHRESLQETAQYLDDFFRRRNSTGEQLDFDRSPIKLPHALNPQPTETGKKSYFQKEKLERLNERTFPSEERSESVQSVKQVKSLSKKKRAKSGKQIIEPKKFKLVLQMDRQAREKMIQLNPFTSMKQEQLALLSHKRAGALIVC